MVSKQGLHVNGEAVFSIGDYTNLVIYLAAELSPDARQLHFMQEVIQACLEAGGLLLRIQQQDPQDEESIVRDITHLLASVIFENPHVFPKMATPFGYPLRIGPVWYSITSEEVIHMDGILAYGEADSFEKTIKLLRSLPEQKVRIVFIHELLHAIMGVSGLRYQTREYAPPEMLDVSSVCRDIATFFVMVLQDNEVLRDTGK